ncbi:16726_t:CDS:2, partial [Racocetra persica]
EEFDDDCLVPAIKSKGIIVWGCFSWWGLGSLVCLYGSITSASYHKMLSHYTISKLQDQYSNSNKVKEKLQKFHPRPGNLNELERIVKEE